MAAASALFLVLAVFLAIAQAAEVKIPLMGRGVWKKASGEAVIKDAEAGQKETTIDAKGLKKNWVYTAWFVNMKPKMEMAGIGTGIIPSREMIRERGIIRRKSRPLTSKNGR